MDATNSAHRVRSMNINPTYRTWWGMMQRCLNGDAINYEDYGGPLHPKRPPLQHKEKSA